MTRVLLILLVVSTALTSFARLARASDADLPRLVVTRSAGAEECPDAATLAGLVWSLGQRRVTASTAAQSSLVVHVAIERTSAGYFAVLHTRGTQQGTRTLSDVGPSCQSLAEALAVIIAVVLDAGPPTRAAPELAADGVADDADAAADAGRAPGGPGPRRPGYAGLEALGGITVALLANPVAAAGGGFTWRSGRTMELALGGLGLQRDVVTTEGGEIALDLALAYLRGCVAMTRDPRVVLELCATPMVGSLRGEGKEFDVAHDVRRLPYAAIGLGPASRGMLSNQTSWWIAASGVVPFVRHGFRVREGSMTDEPFRLGAVGLWFTMGLGWEFKLR